MSDYLITIDDKRLEDFGLYLEEGQQHPATPYFQHNTMEIAGMPGVWDFGTEIREKRFEFPIATNGIERFEMQRRINSLVAFLCDEFGKPREIKLVFDYEPDKFYTAKLAEQFVPDMVKPFTRFYLPFIAFDPFKYASANQYDPKENYKYDEQYLYDIGLMYDNPKSFKWQYSKHYSGVNNYSSLATHFVIEIQGTVQNGSITNLENNQKLTLPNISNGKLVVDGKRFAIIRNGTAILEGSNYNFFDIQPGEVGFLFEGDNAHATVTYKWLHKFN